MLDHTTLSRDHTIGVGRDHIHIEFVEKYPDLMPGKLFFECQSLSAHLTQDACRQNWDMGHRKLKGDEIDKRPGCRSCNIGRQLHSSATTDAADWQDVRRPGECVRCGRVAVRVIGSGECASCFNRRRETIRGLNARGRPMGTPVNLEWRRVGLMVKGTPTYRRFLAWHDGEAISSAVRQVNGARFHAEQPAKSVWNAKASRFEYRCGQHPGEFGSLRELVSADGTIQYVCPTCHPGRAKGLPEARVEAGTSILPREIVEMICQPLTVPPTWTSTAHICDRCQHYPVQVRRRSGDRVESRCPLCDQQ